jgi:hypothetical protein
MKNKAPTPGAPPNLLRFHALTLLPLLALCFTGCAFKPLKGGHAITTNPVGGLHQTLTQGDNPAASTRQAQETVRVRTYTLPAGTRIEQFEPGNAPTLQRSNAPTFLILPSPVPVTERSETRANTELGAAQKDTAREIGAKLSSLKGIVWVGVGLFVFGLASMFWVPLKAVIGSVTTSMAITLGGVALIILPTLIVGNEPLILGGVALVVGAWLLAHRHGHLRGQLATASPNQRTRSPGARAVTLEEAPTNSISRP